MKAIYWSLALLCYAFLASGQKTGISGLLIEFNSKYETGRVKYVENGMVSEEFGRCNPALTGVGGTFTLDCFSVKSKSGLSLIVSKQGWEVVNSDLLRAVADQIEEVRLLLCPHGKILENKKIYYKIGKTEGERYLAKQEILLRNELKKAMEQHVRDTATIRNLNLQLQQVAKEQSNLENNLVAVVNRLVFINLDEANKRSLDAFTVFRRGDISQALDLLDFKVLQVESSLYDSLDLKGKILSSMGDSLQQIAKNGKRKLAEDYILGASLATLQFDYGKAYNYYIGATKTQPLNFNYKVAFSSFLIDQKKFNEALEVVNEMLVIANSNEQLLIASLSMGNLLRITRNKKSSVHYFRAIKLCDSLIRSKNEETEGTALNGLGMYYFDIDRQLDSAEFFFLRSYDLKEKLFKKDSSELHRHELFKTALNLVAVYAEKKDCEQGKKYGKKAIDGYSILARQQEIPYSHYYGMALINYSNLLRHCNNQNEALKFLQIAALEYTNLSKKNSEAYQPDLSLVYVNMGTAYDDLSDFENAKRYAELAYIIRKKYFDIYPNAYAELLALTVINLARATYYREHRVAFSEDPDRLKVLRLLEESKVNLNKHNKGTQGLFYLRQIQKWIQIYNSQ